MVTVRTFWSPAQAALAKSLLDNYDIRCALLDENSSVYSRGGQFAVPIRLVVDKTEAIRAGLILSGDFERAADFEAAEDANEIALNETSSSEVPDRNPWELLMIAFYFLLPAICLVATRFPQNVTGRWARYYIARATVTQFLGWVGVIFAAFLVTLYFWMRRSARKQPAK
jgi:hypothetical protein